MSVRGTTHARHHKKIIIREDNDHQGQRICCAWDDCDNDALSLFVLRVHDYYKPGYGPPSKYAFCCQRHLEYWRTSHLRYGYLPAGLRGTIL